MFVQIRDPVHNFIELREKERELVNTLAFQRLRRIRQLAMAYLVYPGALHTRFEHSLGVKHVAGLMAENLELGDDDKETIRYAALLHDIGHGPFSHVSEDILERYAERTSLRPDQKKEKIHEIITIGIIQNDSQINAILGQITCDKIASLLSEWRGEPVLRSLVSGPLDADKQDYLLRDSLFCGVKYGIFDLHQLHRSLIAYGIENNRDLMIKEDGIHAVEQFVLAKYYLTTNVYLHKVRLITDQMIIRAIILGIEKDNNDKLRKLYSFNNTTDYVNEFIKWDDARFLQTFGLEDNSGKCQMLLKRLVRRNLLKRVFTAKPTDFVPEIRELLMKLTEIGSKYIRFRIESEIAAKVAEVIKSDIDADFVILNTFTIDSVKEISQNDESSILVAKYPVPVPFENTSNLFASINEAFKEVFVDIYAPVNWQTRSERKQICERLKETIKNIIEQVCKANMGGK
ncbi:MAG: HD domain-containing protein [Candidatus Sumerlaeota bacterium]|nr:HD domain-containing protein [Candidatus Sumerlaeota bacterium]